MNTAIAYTNVYRSLRIVILTVLLLAGGRLRAQEYTGTMTYGSYRQDNVRAVLHTSGNKATLTLYHIKFSRMMPINIDATLSDITVSGDSLMARRIVPTAGGKPYPKFAVTDLRGRLTPQQASGYATMNGKRFTFTGKRKK